MRKDIDIQLLKRVLLHAKIYFQLRLDSLTKPAEIVCALVNETLVQINKEIPIQKVIFDYEEIHQLVWGKPESSANVAKKVRDHKVKVLELLAEDSELSQYLIDQGESNYLTFETNESIGGAGAKTTMYLALSGDGNNIQSSNCDIAIYRATQLKKPYFWIKPFTNTVLKGWGVWGFLLIPMCGLLGIPYLVFSLSKTQSVFYSIFAVLCIYILWRLGLIVYELMEKGVAKAPDWMIRLSDKNALFTVNREYSTAREKRGHKVIELVIYEASCPVCGDFLYIENGGKEFNARYVGKCNIAPKEHTFTFDHVTKIGKLVR